LVFCGGEFTSFIIKATSRRYPFRTKGVRWSTKCSKSVTECVGSYPLPAISQSRDAACCFLYRSHNTRLNCTIASVCSGGSGPARTQKLPVFGVLSVPVLSKKRVYT
jgi:hypothetical protein